MYSRLKSARYWKNRAIQKNRTILVLQLGLSKKDSTITGNPSTTSATERKPNSQNTFGNSRSKVCNLTSNGQSSNACQHTRQGESRVSYAWKRNFWSWNQRRNRRWTNDRSFSRNAAIRTNLAPKTFSARINCNSNCKRKRQSNVSKHLT